MAFSNPGSRPMNSPSLTETLDALVHAERRSLLPRLHESTVFVSWASAAEADAVRIMVAEEREHVNWLVDLINELGESPTPCTFDIHSATFHYMGLSYVLPMVLSNKKQLLQTYEHRAAGAAADARAAALVSRIQARHQAHLRTLESFAASATPCAPASP